VRSDLLTATGVAVSLRDASAADEPFLQQLYADRRLPELAPLGWPEQAVAGFLAMQFAAQQSGYGGAFPNADHWIVSEGRVPVGRLLVDRGPAEHLVVDLVVLGQRRGRGIGTALVEEVLADAEDAHVPVTLTAAALDPRLAAWYVRLGFRVVERVGIDLRMVRDPS
jgi:GNAT superfamily N-acetyltransferase